MRFLICGLGSIGQRHYRNLLLLGEQDVIVFRTGQGAADFVAKFVEEYQPRQFFSLAEALAEKPDVALITNPTAYHVPVAIEAARCGRHLFLEKPVSDSWSGLTELLSEVEKRSLITYVAYNLRFHPLLLQIREWLKDEDKFGRPISVHAEMAERVTDWHPWEDYRQSYACRDDLGGGVILTQSHEFDYLYWLFGAVSQISAIGGQLGDLGIEVEDVVKVIMRFKSGLVGSLDIDYLKRPPKRSLEIVTTRGRIFWDYFGKTVSFVPLVDQDQERLVVGEPEGFERNTTFLAELSEFIRCVKSRIETVNPLNQAVEVLKIILAARSSLEVCEVADLS